MNLTNDHFERAKSGQPVAIAANGDDFVLIRKDVFERMSQPCHDDSELSDDELHAIASQTLEDLDTAGPIE